MFLKGIGINCSKINQIEPFGRLMRQHFPELTLLTYPNSGEEWTNEGNTWGDCESKWVKTSDASLSDFVPLWKETGFKYNPNSIPEKI